MIDTCILLDAMFKKREHHAEADRIVQLSNQHLLNACVCASSFKDAYFIASKEVDDEHLRKLIRVLAGIFIVIPVDKALLLKTAESDEVDFEDGIIRSAAEQEKLDFIVSHDKKAFMNSSIKKLSSAELVALIG